MCLNWEYLHGLTLTSLVLHSWQAVYFKWFIICLDNHLWEVATAAIWKEMKVIIVLTRSLRIQWDNIGDVVQCSLGCAEVIFLMFVFCQWRNTFKERGRHWRSRDNPKGNLPSATLPSSRWTSTVYWSFNFTLLTLQREAEENNVKEEFSNVDGFSHKWKIMSILPWCD